MGTQFASRLLDVRWVGTVAVAAVAMLGGTGCHDDSITVYRIPKETLSQAAPEPASPAAAGATAVQWSAPAGWEAQPPSGFRKGSYLVHGPSGQQADVSIISFPESAGGLLANVNRWRDQLKLAPVADVSAAATPIEAGGHQLYFVDIVSEQPLLPGGLKSRVLGGILETPGETWFFKMAGEDQLVAAQRDTFRQFLTSLNIGSSAAALPPAVTAEGTNVPTPSPLAPPEKAELRYQVPAGWQEQPLTAMRAASFKVPGPGGKDADVSVVFLTGMAGGDLANVNRWRDQLKLAPIDEQELAQSSTHVQANGNHDFLVVDLVSAAPVGQPPVQTRILGAILNENDRSWFVKMTGEDSLVAAQKNAFTGFLSNLTLP